MNVKTNHLQLSCRKGETIGYNLKRQVKGREPEGQEEKGGEIEGETGKRRRREAASLNVP